jgi:CRISPR-associated helicase Cas3
MTEEQFTAVFKKLTENAPFPWQWELYNGWFAKGKFPRSCNIPTGLGKTSIVAVWLIALVNRVSKELALQPPLQAATPLIEALRRNLSDRREATERSA